MEISTNINGKLIKESYYIRNAYIQDKRLILVVSNPNIDEKIIRIKESEIEKWE